MDISLLLRPGIPSDLPQMECFRLRERSVLRRSDCSDLSRNCKCPVCELENCTRDENEGHSWVC